MMQLIYLSLGSNLGRREQNLERALVLIKERVGQPESLSRIYESEPWGYSSSSNFYNCCISLHSGLAPQPLMEDLLQIEHEMGRRRGGRGYTDRVIDIDLLLYGNSCINTPGLTVPHPSMADRKFVLAPLAEIAAGVVHPVSGKAIQSMLEECADQSEPVPLSYKFFSSSSSQNI